MNDRQLIQRVILNDDRRAFAELVKNHQSALRASIRQWTRWDHALADDLAQEVFVKAYRKLHQFEQRAVFSTWLYRIAYTTWLNHLDKKQLQLKSLDDVAEPFIEAGLAQTKVALDIERALAQLTPVQRIAIDLCLQQGFSHPEAAQIMALPLGTVKTHVLRGKAQLQLLMTDYQELAHG